MPRRETRPLLRHLSSVDLPCGRAIKVKTSAINFQMATSRQSLAAPPCLTKM